MLRWYVPPLPFSAESSFTDSVLRNAIADEDNIGEPDSLRSFPFSLELYVQHVSPTNHDPTEPRLTTTPGCVRLLVVLTVRSRNAGGDTETCSHAFPIDQLHKVMYWLISVVGTLVSVLTLANSCATRLQGGAWSVRVPITIASFAPIHVDGLLCARFTPPRPSAGAPLGKADARQQHERWCRCLQN
jgi:hypothetical protein